VLVSSARGVDVLLPVRRCALDTYLSRPRGVMMPLFVFPSVHFHAKNSRHRDLRIHGSAMSLIADRRNWSMLRYSRALWTPTIPATLALATLALGTFIPF